jgi:hypothetical protein
MKKLIALTILTVTLVGCEERYRYPCQDPANWTKDECYHPKCEVDGQCRDDLTGGVSEKVLGTDKESHPTETEELPQ